MNSSTSSKYLVLIFIVSFLVFFSAPFLGSSYISFQEILNPSSTSTEATIFWDLRVPRVILAYLAGAALALSGMTFQALFRNSLATPFTLGVASGASLGATVFLKTGLVLSVFGISGVSIFAGAGALLSIAAVYGISRIQKSFTTSTLLLAGLALSFFFSSLIMFIQYISDFTLTFHTTRWLMGGLEAVGYDVLFQLGPIVLVGSFIVLALTHELNVMTTGEEIAISRGVNVNALKHILFFTTSLMVGGVVALCGPIGFVGMMVPHISRLIVGANHRALIPASFLFGGAFLVLCDTLARTIISPAEIPVGVITSLLGGPFFLWLLLSHKNT